LSSMSVGFLFGLLFCPEYGGDIFFRKPKRPDSHQKLVFVSLVRLRTKTTE
jgi:hypothetical protein